MMGQDEVRWERTKLTANYWNGLATVATSAAIVALPIALLSQPRLGWIFNIMCPFLIVAGVLLHLIALRHLKARRPRTPAEETC